MTRFIKPTIPALSALVLCSLCASHTFAQEISVGVMNATTGGYAIAGVPMQNTIKMVLEDANQKGILGSMKIRIVEGDTAGEKGQTVNLMNQFAQRDKVMMIIGPTTSVEGVAAAAVSNDLKVPMLAGGTTELMLAAGPWSFKVQQSTVPPMTALAKYVAEKTAVKRVGLIFDQGNDAFVTQKNAFRDAAKAAGTVIVSEDAIQASDSNFLALATKLAGQNLDGVLIVAGSELTGNLAIQLRQAGLPAKVRFIGPSTMASLNVIKIAGRAVEGAYIVSDYSSGNPSAVNMNFVNAYKAKFNSLPDSFAALGYTQAQITVAAIKNAGPNPDRTKIRDALAKLTGVPVVLGNGTWDMNSSRQPSYGGILLTIENGKFAVLK